MVRHALFACLLAPTVLYADSAETLAKRIDARLAAIFQADDVKPAPRADDAEFLRRVTLDLTGRIPRAAEVHAFLADTSLDKRRRLIDRLLADPRFAVHFANVWRADLLPEVVANRAAGVFQIGFESWLRDRLQSGVGYDRIVHELLTAPIAAAGSEAEPVLRDPNRPNPLAFFAVKEARPENLAAGVTRSFLGIQLECAQCHDHPFAKWKQEQFWGQAAFFAGIERQGEGIFAPLTEAVTLREVKMPNGKRALAARFLDDAAPGQGSPRRALADWVTSPANPFFARAAVNRLWGQLLGFGLVDPVDDFRDDNPPSAPELLDDLAQAFADAKFDVRHLVRALCLTDAYQRSSARTDASQDKTRLPARMPLRALTGEQLFDSLALATGYRDDQDKGTARKQFLVRFALAGSVGEPETSVQQALTLRNGAFTAWATDPNVSPTLIAVNQTPGMTRRERVEALYVVTLARKPSASEWSRLEKRLNKEGAETEQLADVFWMLLNSAEFRHNH